MRVIAAIRQSHVVEQFPCKDLVKQVRKISTNNKPAPRTRARESRRNNACIRAG